jgi:hypothetical protein
MNQTQRSFLIKKIEETANLSIKVLENSKPKFPSLDNWLLHKVLSNDFEIKSLDEIRDAIKKKALSARQGNNKWLGGHWGEAGTPVVFNVNDIFVLPKEYRDEVDECRKQEVEINEQIMILYVQKDTLITRIQLASDKILQSMISEVDDMGNISLIDTKMKQLSQ